MRGTLKALTLACPLFALVMMAAPITQGARSADVERITLMQTLAEWQYPASKLHGGATMSDGGNPHLQSVKCAAVLTTPDPVDKVVAFYAEKFGAVEPGGKRPAKADVKEGEAKSVTEQDDSKSRPLTLRIFVVNKADTSTTLVISRAEGEKETHVAWSHYIRIGDGK